MATKKYTVKDSLGFWITTLARTIEQDFENRIVPYGVSRTGYAILSSVKNGNCSTPACVATYLGVGRAAVTRHLDRLEKSEFIARIKNDEDKRSLQIELTNEGKKVLSSLMKESQNTNKKVLEKINNREAESLLRTIKTIIGDDYLPPKKF
ncbi:MAG: MarR family transcriptional regulator [Halobacteriovoraceae bacterium]|jgi:DNA-binding MarR family transcriptional regulator|nr:MarR family transcriptional regulator [Halobacteriovoraceae bacterium]